MVCSKSKHRVDRHLINSDDAGARELEAYILSIEARVIGFADELGLQHASFCNSTSPEADCREANFDACHSDVSLDTSTVLQAPSDPWSFTDSSEAARTSAICFSHSVDPWLVESSSQWTTPPSYTFASETGITRRFPAYSSCCEFVPSEQPWYLAGSSGAKNLVLLMDVSASMAADGRLESLKEAVKHVVETLNTFDRVAIVPFAEHAELLADETGYMLAATRENKAWLLHRIDELQARGTTNFYDAFVQAFDVLERSALQEMVDCNSAVLFFTDGQSAQPEVSQREVLAFVNERMAATEVLTGHAVLLFTYSIGHQGDQAVHTFPKDLACSAKYGVWSRIDSVDRISESFTSYHKLFSLGLGSSRNEGFVAWTGPYRLLDGAIGSTVSTPVYDRTRERPHFLGVAAMDVTLLSAEATYGNTSAATTVLKQLASRVAASCPSIDLLVCELEWFRQQGAAGHDATCTNVCKESDLASLGPQPCDRLSLRATDIWDNWDRATSVEQCPVPDNTSSPKATNPIGIDVWIGWLVALHAVVLVAWLIIKRRRNKMAKHIDEEVELELATVASTSTPDPEEYPSLLDRPLMLDGRSTELSGTAVAEDQQLGSVRAPRGRMITRVNAVHEELVGPDNRIFQEEGEMEEVLLGADGQRETQGEEHSAVAELHRFEAEESPTHAVVAVATSDEGVVMPEAIGSVPQRLELTDDDHIPIPAENVIVEAIEAAPLEEGSDVKS